MDVAGTGRHWVDTWVAVPQRTEPATLPPPPFTRDGRALAGSTLRQTVRVSVGGQRIRLCLSNAFSATPLSVAAVSVARPLGGRAGVSAIEPATARRVTFRGRPSVVVPERAQVESDPLDVDLPPRTNLTVTMYLPDGLPVAEVTSHQGSRTTSYLLAGNRVADLDLAGATPIDHWYLLSGVRVPARATSAMAVVIGDSLTDGRGSTTNGNDRWPDRLLDRLHAHPDRADVAILNHAAGGSRLLDEGLSEILACSALRWLVIFKGINDIGTAPATPAAQRRVTSALIQAYDYLAGQARGCGVRVYGATLLPFGGHLEYDDPHGHREAARRTVNEWIRGSGRFDAVLDFDAAVRDPGDSRRLSPDMDSGDHLHLNPLGYRALADSVALEAFEPVEHGR